MIKENKKYISSSGWFKLEYPMKWIVKEDNNHISFFNSISGVGALQISSYEAPQKDLTNLKCFSRDFFEEKEVEAEIVEFSKDRIRFALSEFNKAGRYWKVWCIASVTKFLFVTYNCDVADKEKEQKNVNDIISSLQLKD